MRVNRMTYLANRLAWLHYYGEWPSFRMGFKDGDPANIRIANLAPKKGLTGAFDHSTREGRIAYLRAHRSAFPDHYRDIDLRRTFGISLDQYKGMLAGQRGLCAICEQPETEIRGGRLKALAVDHCHETGEIRGLLCTACNKALGYFRDDEKRIGAALRYIDHHKRRRKLEQPNVVRLRGRNGASS